MGFMEELINRKFDLKEEILSLNKLLNEESNKSYLGEYCSIEEVVEHNFRKWFYRNNYINLQQMKEGMRLTSLLKRLRGDFGATTEEYINYAEYVMNICSFCSQYFDHDNIELIHNNIENVLDYLNHKIEVIKDKDLIVIIPKSYEVEYTVNIIREPNLCENILLYNHHSNKGKVFDKATILSRLFMYYENKLEKVVVGINKTLDLEIGELSNKLKIRHDKPNTKEEIVVADMSDEELEGWYDKLFALYLRTIILVDNLKVKPEIDELRKRLNGWLFSLCLTRLKEKKRLDLTSFNFY